MTETASFLLIDGEIPVIHGAPNFRVLTAVVTGDGEPLGKTVDWDGKRYEIIGLNAMFLNKITVGDIVNLFVLEAK